MVESDRRSFLTWATHGLGAIFAAVLGLPALAYLVDARNRKAPDSSFRPVQGVRASDLGEVCHPLQGVIRAVRHDAWTLHPSDVVGRVWIVRNKPGTDAECFTAFTTECPHLGCSINVAPRNMDSLELELARDPDNADPNNRDLFMVRFQKFYQTRSDKVPRA